MIEQQSSNCRKNSIFDQNLNYFDNFKSINDDIFHIQSDFAFSRIILPWPILIYMMSRKREKLTVKNKSINKYEYLCYLEKEIFLSLTNSILSIKFLIILNELLTKTTVQFAKSFLRFFVHNYLDISNCLKSFIFSKNLFVSPQKLLSEYKIDKGRGNHNILHYNYYRQNVVKNSNIIHVTCHKLRTYFRTFFQNTSMQKKQAGCFIALIFRIGKRNVSETLWMLSKKILCFKYFFQYQIKKFCECFRNIQIKIFIGDLIRNSIICWSWLTIVNKMFMLDKNFSIFMTDKSFQLRMFSGANICDTKRMLSATFISRGKIFTTCLNTTFRCLYLTVKSMVFSGKHITCADSARFFCSLQNQKHSALLDKILDSNLLALTPNIFRIIFSTKIKNNAEKWLLALSYVLAKKNSKKKKKLHQKRFPFSITLKKIANYTDMRVYYSQLLRKNFIILSLPGNFEQTKNSNYSLLSYIFIRQFVTKKYQNFIAIYSIKNIFLNVSKFLEINNNSVSKLKRFNTMRFFFNSKISNIKNCRMMYLFDVVFTWFNVRLNLKENSELDYFFINQENFSTSKTKSLSLRLFEKEQNLSISQSNILVQNFCKYLKENDKFCSKSASYESINKLQKLTFLFLIQSKKSKLCSKLNCFFAFVYMLSLWYHQTFVFQRNFNRLDDEFKISINKSLIDKITLRNFFTFNDGYKFNGFSFLCLVNFCHYNFFFQHPNPFLEYPLFFMNFFKKSELKKRSKIFINKLFEHNNHASQILKIQPMMTNNTLCDRLEDFDTWSTIDFIKKKNKITKQKTSNEFNRYQSEIVPDIKQRLSFGTRQSNDFSTMNAKLLNRKNKFSSKIKAFEKNFFSISSTYDSLRTIYNQINVRTLIDRSINTSTIFANIIFVYLDCMHLYKASKLDPSLQKKQKNFVIELSSLFTALKTHGEVGSIVEFLSKPIDKNLVDKFSKASRQHTRSNFIQE